MPILWPDRLESMRLGSHVARFDVLFEDGQTYEELFCSCGARVVRARGVLAWSKGTESLWWDHVQQACLADLRTAQVAYTQARRRLNAAVDAARAAKVTWEQIGFATHMTRQSAQGRWGGRGATLQ